MKKEPNTDFVVLILGQKVIYAQDKVLLTTGFVQVKSKFNPQIGPRFGVTKFIGNTGMVKVF